jgi:hypothetical protein
MPGLLLRLVLLAVCLSVPAWLVLQHFAAVEPYLYPLHTMQAPAVAAGPRLLLGAYPDRADLAQLKRAGYVAVVSLLSPEFVYEQSLLERERDEAGALGLQFYNFPMLSDEPAGSRGNAAALRAIAQLLARSPGSRTYIHCYLGRHRSRMVSEWLRQQGIAPPQ